MTAERIARLAATPKLLAQIVVEASDELLDRLPAAGEWPPRVVLAHFRDDEYLCMRLGLERALAEDRPEVVLLDGAGWVAMRNTTRDSRATLLGDFALQRQASVSILGMLRVNEWERRLGSAGRGEFTIAQFLDAWLQHDAEHLAQIERALGETAAEARERRARTN